MITPAPLQDPDDIKVFILYLLNRVGYPLKYDRVADIVVQDGMVNFMDFGTYFFELLDAGHIKEIQNKPGEDTQDYSHKEFKRQTFEKRSFFHWKTSSDSIK